VRKVVTRYWRKILKPYYEDEFGIKSYQGDCLKVLPYLEELADIVITSPPYNVGIKYDGDFNDKRPLPVFKRWLKKRLKAVYQMSRDPSRLYLFTGDSMSYWVRMMVEDIGWTYHQRITWCKPNICGSTLKISGDWNFLTEDILLFHKGKRTPMLNEVRGVNTPNWIVASSPQSQYIDNRRVHPAQFPVDLVMKLAARTPGRLILDPFCGSCSTLVAAKRLGRKAIGIDLSAYYLDIGAGRLKQTTMKIKPQYEQRELELVGIN
jgi:DNA modification methylase